MIRSVLIIDDDRDFSRGLADLLTLDGFTVELTDSAGGAMNALKSFPAEVALVDPRLSQGSGIDLIKNLHGQYPNLLCVMVTAHADLDTAITALRQGAYDYLRKPFRSEDLLATLHRCFDRIDIAREKNQAEEALRRTQKLEAIEQLSGGIAHDFNNQLGIVIGYLDFLGSHTEDNEELHKCVESATRATLRCMDLTRQLLASTRRQVKQKKVVSINATLSELETMVTRSVTPEVDVQYSLADDLWLTEIDIDEFQDVILNLVINARDAMPNGGKLTIETSNNTLEADCVARNPEVETGDYVQLMLSDTGTGMDKETLGHVFEPFFSTKPEGKGTGLGLAMVYGFVKRYAGHIEIHSDPGVGTDIRLYLPRSIASASSDIFNSHEIKLPRGSETILIVDDEIDLLQLADLYLSDLGYNTHQAENAAHALEILAEDGRIDLLFTDVVMPGGMNGYDLAKQAVQQGRDLKVLLTSGFNSKAVTYSGHARLSANLLSKPYRKAELAQRIRLVLDEETVSMGSFAGCTVLVVDDEKDMQELFKVNLEMLGYKALQARNGDEAIALYQRSLENGNRINAVILDLTFPGFIGGNEIAEKMRSLDPQARIIVASGHTASPEMTNYRDYGYAGALEKNFNKGMIKQVLEKVLSSSVDSNR